MLNLENIILKRENTEVKTTEGAEATTNTTKMMVISVTTETNNRMKTRGCTNTII